ncbi:MAG: twin-arginine translocation signal domain-containing protein [bacterium]
MKKVKEKIKTKAQENEGLSRRDFIAKTALAGASFAAGQFA